MKKLFTGMLLMAFLPAFAQFKAISGNGNIKTETREVGTVASVLSHGSLNVHISYGNATSLRVEGEENLLPYVETINDHGTLTVKFKNNISIRTNKGITVYLSMTSIKNLKQSGSGNIDGEGSFTGDDTELSVSGSGSIHLPKVTFGELKITVSGSGSVLLKDGTADKISANVSGSGNVDCLAVISKDIEGRISGSGNLRVYARNSIDARISGSGNIFYKGEAASISTKTSGSGRAIKI